MRLIKNPLSLLIFSSLAFLALTSANRKQLAEESTSLKKEVLVSEPIYTPRMSKDAIIYEINVRQYSPAGDFAAVTSDSIVLKILALTSFGLCRFTHWFGPTKRKFR